MGDQDHQSSRPEEVRQSPGSMIGKQGKRYVSIPLPQIQLPRFRFGNNPEAGRRPG